MKLTFVQTGGTIDKGYPRKTKGYCFEITEPAVKRILKKVSPNFEFNIISVLKKDSRDITAEDREAIYETCKQIENDKIIVTHGTDTMLETAKKLRKIISKTISKTIDFLQQEQITVLSTKDVIEHTPEKYTMEKK